MGNCGIFAAGYHLAEGGYLIVGIGLAPLNGDGSLGAFTNAGSQPIAHQLAN